MRPELPYPGRVLHDVDSRTRSPSGTVSRMRVLPPRLLFLPLALAACLAFQSRAHAETSTFSLSGGVAGNYSYFRKSYGVGFGEFGPGWHAAISIGRRFGKLGELRESVGVRHYSHPVAYGGIPEKFFPEAVRTATIIPVGLLLRLYASRPDVTHPVPFLELGPSIFWTRLHEWRVYNRYAGGVFQTYVSSFEVVRPGFLAGTGFQGPLSRHLRLELSAQYSQSTRSGTGSITGGSKDDFAGLRLFAFAVGVTWNRPTSADSGTGTP